MIFIKDGMSYSVTDPAMIDAFTASGWTQVDETAVKAEVKQENGAETPAPKPAAKRGRTAKK